MSKKGGHSPFYLTLKDPKMPVFNIYTGTTQPVINDLAISRGVQDFNESSTTYTSEIVKDGDTWIQMDDDNATVITIKKQGTDDLTITNPEVSLVMISIYSPNIQWLFSNYFSLLFTVSQLDGLTPVIIPFEQDFIDLFHTMFVDGNVNIPNIKQFLLDHMSFV